MPNKKEILIAEVVPGGNKGELALAYGIKEALGDKYDYDIKMFSFDKPYDAPRYEGLLSVIDTKQSWPIINTSQAGVSIIRSLILMFQHLAFMILAKISTRLALAVFKGHIWSSYLSADLILTGHDSNYGIGGDPETPLLYPFYLPFFCSVLGKKIMFVAGTVPRLPKRLKWLFKILYRVSLKKMDAVTLREYNSEQHCLNVGLSDTDYVVTADIAYLMKPSSDDVGREILIKEGIDIVEPSPLIGITMSWSRGKIAFPDANSEAESYDMHTTMMAQALDDIINKLNARIVFIPHSVGKSEKADDRITGWDVKDKVQNSESIYVMSGEYDAPCLKSVLGLLDVFIGERLHSVIGASSMGTPSIAISYKIDPRLGMVEPMVTSQNIIHLEDLSVESLSKKVLDLYANREDVKIVLCQNLIKIKARSLENSRILLDLLG